MFVCVVGAKAFTVLFVCLCFFWGGGAGVCRTKCVFY